MAAWTESEITALAAMKQQGKLTSEIASHLGRSESAVRHKSSEILRGSRPAHPGEPVAVSPHDVAEFQQSAMTVTRDWVDDEEVDAADEWARAEKRGAKAIEKAKKQGRFNAKFGAAPIAIAFVSDQHIAEGTPCDMARMREDAELIRDTPNLFCILAGDAVDNHIKHTSAMMAARSQPGDQYRLFNYYLQILGEKVTCLISGNHDSWTNQIGGIDMLHWISEQNKRMYAPDEAYVTCSVGGVEYRIAVRHQYTLNSRFNQTHSNKQWLRNFPSDELPDIVCIAHHHEHAIEQATMFGKHRWFCRPGAYQISSAYSRQYGFNITSPTCPTFILYPDRHEIVGFGDIRAAVRFLENER